METPEAVMDRVLEFTVVLHKNERLFRFGQVFLEALTTFSFPHGTTLEVRKDGEIITKGRVRYFGTHAGDWFWFIDPEYQPLAGLIPDMFPEDAVLHLVCPPGELPSEMWEVSQYEDLLKQRIACAAALVDMTKEERIADLVALAQAKDDHADLLLEKRAALWLQDHQGEDLIWRLKREH